MFFVCNILMAESGEDCKNVLIVTLFEQNDKIIM